jgi:uncharacterized protein YwqG
MPEKYQEKFESLIAKNDLHSLKEAMLLQAKQAVALIAGDKSKVALPLGQSKLGGRPDTPPDFNWPTKDDKPLSFIAQINLSELPAIESSQLPTHGLLSFFYNNEVWGFDPKDKGGFQVFYFAEVNHLRQLLPPPAVVEKKFFGMFSKSTAVHEFATCSLTPEIILTLPYNLDGIELSDEQSSNYCNLLDDIGGQHRLFGHPVLVQNEMELECELVTNGLYCGDATGYKDPRAAELEKNCHHWKLLLQINSEDNADMMWGDLGMLYFWIKEEDLAALRFDKCWMISQCH